MYKISNQQGSEMMWLDILIGLIMFLWMVINSSLFNNEINKINNLSALNYIFQMPPTVIRASFSSSYSINEW